MSEPLDLEPIKARDRSLYSSGGVRDRHALLAEVERLRDQCELLLAREVAAWDEGYSAGFHDVGYGDTANPILPFADSDGTSDEVERLRDELARRDEQIAVRVIEAVRSMPLGYRPEDVANELEHADLRGTLDGLS